MESMQNETDFNEIPCFEMIIKTVRD